MVLIAALAVGLVPAASKAMRGASYTYDDAESYTSGGTRLPADGIDKIQINWLSGQVEITVHDGTDIYFSETSSEELVPENQMRYLAKGDKLSIQYCASRRNISSWFSSMPSKKLTLSLPASLALDVLEVESVSGSVEMDGGGLWARELSLESVSGEITAVNVGGRKLYVSTVSGSVDITGAFDNVDGESTSGRQTYRLSRTPNDVDVESVSGGVEIRLGSLRGFEASLDTLSGSLRVGFPTTQEGRNVLRYGDGRATFAFDTVSGSVSIEEDASLAATPAPVEAKATPKATPTPAPSSGAPIPSSERKF